MLKKIKKKIRSNKGITGILLCAFSAFMIALLVFVLDGGRGYAYKMELQQIADAMSLGGARYGVRTYQNIYDGAKVDMVITEGKAKSKASELLSKNLNHPDNIQLTNISANYNFEGKIDSQLKETLYNSGVFHVELTAKYPRLIGGGYQTVQVSSTNKLTPTKGNVNANDVRVIDGNVIQIYDSKGKKIFEKAVR